MLGSRGRCPAWRDVGVSELATTWKMCDWNKRLDTCKKESGILRGSVNDYRSMLPLRGHSSVR